MTRRRNIAGLPQPRAAKARVVVRNVRLEPAEARAQVAAAKRAGKTWSDWIRWLAAREIEATRAPVRDLGGWVLSRSEPSDVDICDLCVRPTRWRHPAGGRRCGFCPRPAGAP